MGKVIVKLYSVAVCIGTVPPSAIDMSCMPCAKDGIRAPISVAGMDGHALMDLGARLAHAQADCAWRRETDSLVLNIP